MHAFFNWHLLERNKIPKSFFFVSGCNSFQLEQETEQRERIIFSWDFFFLWWIFFFTTFFSVTNSKYNFLFPLWTSQSERGHADDIVHVVVLFDQMALFWSTHFPLCLIQFVGCVLRFDALFVSTVKFL